MNPIKQVPISLYTDMNMCPIRHTFMFLEYYKASATTDRGSSVADNVIRQTSLLPIKMSPVCLYCDIIVMWGLEWGVQLREQLQVWPHNAQAGDVSFR